MAKKFDTELLQQNLALAEDLTKATGATREHKTASPEEAAQRRAERRTQGKKGCKAIRINMAFSAQNHEFIKIMAIATGMTMTDFVNFALNRYMEEHGEQYRIAKELRENL